MSGRPASNQISLGLFVAPYGETSFGLARPPRLEHPLDVPDERLLGLERLRAALPYVTAYGTNAWIYCTFMAPETPETHAAWRAAMPRPYYADLAPGTESSLSVGIPGLGVAAVSRRE